MERLNKDYFDSIRKAQAEGEPIITYRKSIRARVCVKLIDSFSGMPSELILSGVPGSAAEEDITVSLWTDFEVDFFRRANKKLLELGYLAPHTLSEEEEVMVNQVSDEELFEALNKPFFAVQALLKRFTAPAPVKRLLDMALEMNKTIGTVDKIKERLSELQQR